MEDLLSTYLSLPLGALFKEKIVWDRMAEFHWKVSMWKRQYIVKRGKLTLIHNTLSNLSIYFMSLVSIPRKVKLRLEKI